ncbi:3-oxoacyl-ACP synthase III family protein [Streptomyces alfalfae]|uniref:3-oxoacyl-ACP synthase III family protein n=1 Tax=Streptomyces alfalfae TaxID=1642299 RepID=UPI001BA68AC9|nr:ketoacyl-ACP synthase III [Streptomyces alfalfae]QUI34611.1 ketoacyl-ACP synthase III [Streptomyces alfalfae]
MTTGIVSLGLHLPGAPVGNDSVAEASGADPAWIQDRIGMHARHHAAPRQTATELAVAAAESALTGAAVTPDLIVVATVTPDRPVPATACFVQERLGLAGVPAFDVNAACSGFIYALSCAHGMTLAAHARTPLVIGADTFTHVVDPTDRRTAPLFGDGAGAVQLGPVPAGYGILAVELWAEGSQAMYATVPREGWFAMDGRSVSGVVMDMGPKILQAALDRAGARLDQLDRVIVHQANPRLVRRLAEHVGLGEDQVPAYGSVTGNTASASVPVALAMADRERPFRRGDLVALVAVGAGMTAGAAVLRWY